MFKVSAFCVNARTKTCASLPDCRVNNTRIQLIPSCQDTRTQFVDVLDLLFSDIACSVIWCLEIFRPKYNIVTKFFHLVLGGLVITPHRVYRHCCSSHSSKLVNYGTIGTCIT